MNPNQYQEKRDELDGLLAKVLALALPTTLAATISSIRKKVHEDQFCIVLISPFQGGKSTTFNALCDGMEISPRGAMLKTSATVISAQNTTDPSLAGTARITWRSDAELIMVFGKIILQHLQKIDPARFATIDSSEQLINAIKFPADLPLLLQSLKTECDIYQKSPGDYDRDTEGANLETLRVALLICNFYNSDFIAHLKQKDSVPVEELAELVCFPDKWEQRWDQGDALMFSAKEVPFVFIKRAHCFVKSPNLARTGSVIVDCPGLFASAYDTRVAMDILESADVVWYLMGGKGIADSELKIIKQVTTAKASGIFFSVNMRETNQKNILENIIPNNVSRLNQSGILTNKVTAEDFHVYHALLGLTSVQAEKVQAGTLDDHSGRALLKLFRKLGGDGLTINELLDETAADALKGIGNLTRQELRDYELFDEAGEGLKTARSQSCLDDIVTVVEKEAIQKRARSILIVNGSAKAAEAIKRVEANLQTEENNALKTEAEMNVIFKDAEDKLAVFQDFCREQLKELMDAEGELIDRTLATDYWENVMEASLKEVTEKAARQIAIADLRDIARHKQIINECFAEVTEPKATAWAISIKEGNNETFKHLVTSRTNRIIERVNQQWQKTLETTPELKGLHLEIPLVGTTIMDTEFIENVIKNAPGHFMNTVAGAGIGAGLGALIGTFVFPVLGTAAGAAIGGYLGALFGLGFSHEERYKRVFEQVSHGLLQSARENKSAVITKQAERLGALRAGILNTFYRAFDKQTQTLNARSKEARMQSKLKTEERQKLAENNRIFRTEKLEPLRKTIEAFEVNVDAILKSEV